jgi:hypothetical protein
MPSDYVLIPTDRFSFTKSTECGQRRSLQPTSLTHLISLVEAGSVPTLSDAAILAIDKEPRVRGGDRTPDQPSSVVRCIDEL